MDLLVRYGNNFDFIRFIAATSVIITHMQVLMGLGECDLLCEWTQGTLSFSHLGVKVFFIISGYLIVKSLINSQTYSGYIWKRVLRIFPGLLFVLLVTIFILGPLATTLSIKDYFSSGETWKMLGTMSLFKLYLNLPGVFENNPLTNSTNGSLWTLIYEFSFYILLLIASFLGFIKRPLVLLMGWLTIFALRVYLGNKIFIYDYSSPYLLNLNILQVIDNGLFFVSGSLFYLFRERIQFDWKISLIVSIILLVSFYFNSNISRLVCYLVFPYLTFYLAFLPSRLNSFGKNGDFSYGIYIFAFPVQQLLVYYFGLTLGLPIMILMSFIITLSFAWISWNYVEKNALYLKDLIK